jgi:hypothetical protein
LHILCLHTKTRKKANYLTSKLVKLIKKWGRGAGFVIRYRSEKRQKIHKLLPLRIKEEEWGVAPWVEHLPSKCDILGSVRVNTGQPG